MNFYHFTSLRHWKEIQECGCIKTTCSNLLPPDLESRTIIDGKIWDKNFDYRKVVWLTDKIKPNEIGLGLNGCIENKTAVRLTISKDNVPDIIKWKHFADNANMDSKWRHELEQGRQASSWYVVEHEIPLECVTSVDILG